MCDPVTISAAAVMVGTSTYSAYQEQKAANQAADYNAEVNERNADIAEAQADNATKRGAQEEKQHRLRVSQTKGTQRSALAGSGVTVDQGSAMDVLMDTTQMGELDALTIRRNAAYEAWGHTTQAQSFRTEASMLRNSKRSPGRAAATSLLTSSSQAVMMGYRPSKGTTKTKTTGRGYGGRSGSTATRQVNN